MKESDEASFIFNPEPSPQINAYALHGLSGTYAFGICSFPSCSTIPIDYQFAGNLRTIHRNDGYIQPFLRANQRHGSFIFPL